MGIILPKEPKKYREALKKEDLKQFSIFSVKINFTYFMNRFFRFFFTGMITGQIKIKIFVML